MQCYDRMLRAAAAPLQRGRTQRARLSLLVAFGSWRMASADGTHAPEPLASSAPPVPPPARFVPQLPCPLAGADAISRTNRALLELLPSGRLEEALACNELTLADADVALAAAVRGGSSGAGDPGAQLLLGPEALEIVRTNAAVLRDALSPQGAGARRLFHNSAQRSPGWPDAEAPLARGGLPDRSILVADGALSEAQCAGIVALFERSELFEGTLLSDGRLHVDHAQKKVSELDVDGEAARSAEWAAVERAALAVVVAQLHRYEEANPALRALRSPLGDEGFRMKRYVDGGAEHHAYHIDTGQEPVGTPARILAVIIYLSSPEAGGETVFLNQGVEVRPACGRVAVFPAGLAYVHAGRRVRKGRKYALTLFVNP